MSSGGRKINIGCLNLNLFSYPHSCVCRFTVDAVLNTQLWISVLDARILEYMYAQIISLRRKIAK